MAIGTPMILMGDEVRRTQYGNNNAYCHNNELSWFDWSLLKKHSDIYRFVKHLIYARLQRDVSKPEYSMSLNQLLQKRLVNWHGVKLNQPDWSNHSHSIAFTIESLSKDVMWHYMVNAYHEALEFELPQVKDASHWKRWIDTSLASPDDIVIRVTHQLLHSEEIFGSAAFDSCAYCEVIIFIVLQVEVANCLLTVLHQDRQC
jgi:glycogen operon protein